MTGVRPNSLIQRIVVLSSRPRSVELGHQRRPAGVELAGQPPDLAEVVGVRVPAQAAAERHFDERHAALHKPPRQQAALAEQAGAVAAADFVRFGRQIERRPHFRPHHVGRLLVQRAVRLERLGAAAFEELLLQRVPQLHAPGGLIGVDARRQLQIGELQFDEPR